MARYRLLGLLALTGCLQPDPSYHFRADASGSLDWYGKQRQGSTCFCMFDTTLPVVTVQLACASSLNTPVGQDMSLFFPGITGFDRATASTFDGLADLDDISVLGAVSGGRAVVELGSELVEHPRGISTVYRPFFVHDAVLPPQVSCDVFGGPTCVPIEEGRIEDGKYWCEDFELTVRGQQGEDVLGEEP